MIEDTRFSGESLKKKRLDDFRCRINYSTFPSRREPHLVSNASVLATRDSHIQFDCHSRPKKRFYLIWKRRIMSGGISSTVEDALQRAKEVSVSYYAFSNHGLTFP